MKEYHKRPKVLNRAGKTESLIRLPAWKKELQGKKGINFSQKISLDESLPGRKTNQGGTVLPFRRRGITGREGNGTS